MACFYELSKFVQIRMQPHYGVPRLSLGLGGDGSAEPKVKVLEEKTLGALDDSPRNRQRQKLPKEYFRLLS